MQLRHHRRLKLSEPLVVRKTSLQQLWENSQRWLIRGFLFGLLAGVCVKAIGGRVEGSIVAVLVGTSGGFIFGLMNDSKVDVETHIKANQEIIDSGKNVIFTLLIALLISPIFEIVVQQSVTLREDSIDIAKGIITISQSCFFWLSFQEGGGKACVQHFALRLTLYQSNSIPWNYARFLNYATERRFLQRVGGRYRFIHKLLQEHMAKMGE